jgi:restriction system protein
MYMWEKRIVHNGLHAYRLIRGQSKEEVETKAALQLAQWEARWSKKVETGQRMADDYAGKQLALARTEELEAQRDALEKLLISVAHADTTLDWDSLKRTDSYPVPPPQQSALERLPKAPEPLPPPEPPPVPVVHTFYPFAPNWSVPERLIPPLRRRKLKEMQEINEERRRTADSLNTEELRKIEDRNQERKRQVATYGTLQETHRRACEAVRQKNEESKAAFFKATTLWQTARARFENEQQTYNEEIRTLRDRYLSKYPDAIKSYFYEVLAKSVYPDSFPKENTIDLSEEGALAIDFELPSMLALPAIKEVKYITARGAFSEIAASDVWLRKTYDEVLYKMCLRTVYELMRADEINTIRSVIFNGWVRSIDRATGSEVHACIMSIEAGKDEFLAINLAHVDPKTCFKRLKGVAASKLTELTAVKPLVLLNREDKRFVAGYTVVEKIDERTNLAAMDWLDFENLIREVFEKEFRKGGGEVKITQASRDGGVDAIAFDPDPIRGGKLVIQAKRYTNTVGVSAVRDLYGTVHNEGANKGILVTTSDFGPDAYAFAKDKPLTLISGAELLYLLSQHGHNAKIDIAEAKRIFAGVP